MKRKLVEGQGGGCGECVRVQGLAEVRAISHRSAALSFHTCAATEYSSTSGSFVMWICSGSSEQQGRNTRSLSS